MVQLLSDIVQMANDRISMIAIIGRSFCFLLRFHGCDSGSVFMQGHGKIGLSDYYARVDCSGRALAFGRDRDIWNRKLG